MANEIKLLGAYSFVRNLDATIGFYECLGLTIDKVSPIFARATMPNGSAIEFGCEDLTRSYDPHWQPPTGPGTNTINLELSSPEAVDETYERMIAAGYAGHLPPCDPLWQARFALLDDPDGNVVGLHSPRDREAERERERE